MERKMKSLARVIFGVALCGMANVMMGVDATIEIVKSGTKLPNVLVEHIADNKDYGERVVAHLVGDLRVSNHFQVQKSMETKKSMDLESYKAKRIDLVAQISVSKNSSNLVARLVLYDVGKKESVLDKQYDEMPIRQYPFIAHKICVDVNAYIKAPNIDWMLEPVLVAKYESSGNTIIALADYTLSYQKDIIKGGMNIFPKWGDRSKSFFYYTKYINNKPTIVRHDLNTNKSKGIVSSDGMAIVSDVSTDGKKILMTLTPDGDAADIYIYDVDSATPRRITAFSGIDVGGKFIDGDSKVAFISDRLGYPNVFATRINGGNVEQVVFHGRNNSAITTHNQYIAYTSRESNNEFGQNTFNIYLISTKSDYIRRLTENGRNQMPSFSKDGKNLMFIKYTPTQSSLGIIRLDYNSSYFFSLPKIKIQAYDW